MITTVIIRLTIAFLILGLASYFDITKRKAENVIWLVAGGIAVPLLVFDMDIAAVGSIVVVVLVSLAFYRWGEMRGGDVKAVWSLALLLPKQPYIFGLPVINISALPWGMFPLAIMMNALILSWVWTAATKRKTLPFMPFLLTGLILSLTIIG